MTAPTPEDRILALRRDLATKRSEILALPAAEALTRILQAPHPVPLVHAFPEEDLHLLIREIGPDDALPLIALASNKQLEYLLDQELWHRDRIDFNATAQWLDRLLRAETPPRRLVRWLAEAKTDLIELFLCRAIEVQMREHDQDPSLFGPGFFSYDEVFYIRILAPAQGDEEAPFTETPLRDTVKRLLDHLAGNDYPRFQAILLEAAHLLPSETEEEEYRLRTARLAERGFLPFEEAVGLYQPLNESLFEHRALRREIASPEHPDHFPIVPAAVLPEGNLFTRALASIASGELHQALQEEFAALCNRIIVADRQTIQGRDDLAGVVAKASGYLSIGLRRQLRNQAASASDVAAAAATFRRYHLEGLFRLGYNEVVQLKLAAERWVHQSWFASRGLPLPFWGETWLGVIGGLLIKRPLFFDNYRSGTLYRNFTSWDDVEWSRRQLEAVQTMDRLLDRMALPHEFHAGKRYLTYQNLLLTLWARHWIALPEDVRPIPVDKFVPFFSWLFQYDALPQKTGPRPITAEAREAFLQWLADRSGEAPDRVASVVGSILERLFGDLEDQYGRVGPAHIDPRYVPHFLLEAPPVHPR